ncbi:MAG: hypothetical protein IJ262_03915 [Clostridia bacterium]|nr:hypothetical protein [Clostridia bacterium]
MRSQIKKILKAESVYYRATKPYKNAESLLAQNQYYSHYGEPEEKYFILKSEAASV